MKMEYLGKSGLQVSRLCLGTMTFGGSGLYSGIGKVPFKECKAIIDTAIDAGINFIDTSNAYSNGLAEEFVGKALGSKRRDVILATKVCHNAGGNGPNDQGLSRQHIINSCEESLKRLKTDYIDIYMMHEDHPPTSLEIYLSTFNDLVRKGVVRYIGCSNFSAWVLMKAISISEKYGLEKIINFQGYYNIGGRELENEHIPLCLNEGIGITTYSPLGGEFFTGNFRRNKPIPKGTRRTNKNVKEFFPLDEDKAYDIVEELFKMAKKHNVSVPQVAINWLLNKRGVTSVLVGVKEVKHLRDNLNVVNWDLSEDEVVRLDEISKPILSYPYWRKRIFGER